MTSDFSNSSPRSANLQFSVSSSALLKPSLYSIFIPNAAAMAAAHPEINYLAVDYLSDVLVLATSAGGADGAVTADVTWVTVAVEPESVQEVIAASRKAELYFALPASGDATGGGGAAGLALGSTVGSDASREGSR